MSQIELFNRCSFSVKDISGQHIDGMTFERAVVVSMQIDGQSLASVLGLDETEAVVVYSELLRSRSEEGTYLIFCGLSGIADDYGWDGVDIAWCEGHVRWMFINQHDSHISWQFEERQYMAAIEEIEGQILLLPDAVSVKPIHIIFPESWETNRNN